VGLLRFAVQIKVCSTDILRKEKAMDEILEILANDARLTPQEIAKLTGKDVLSVKRAIAKYEKEGVIVKYKAVINHELAREANSFVRALIEVSITPQKDLGFDSIAERIYSFPEVTSCYLVSGTYDLLVVVEGENLQTVSNFIASKLAPLEHVRGTATHFLLKKYKEDGQILKKRKEQKRLNISY
jgi:DNA-binding Lrp family transcriptional regulator